MKKKLLKYLIIINGIILFCLCMFWNDSADVLLDFIAFLIFISLSSVVQGIVFLIARRFKTPRIMWIILFLSPSLFLTFNSAYYSLPRVKIRQVISDGRLAEIPESAQNLKVYTWSSLFSGEGFICFEAGPEEIQKFINDSPGLKGIVPKIYSEDKMHIPYPLNYDGNSTHDYFTPDSSAPKWYKEQLRNKGRIYEIPPEEGHNSGTVIIDDSTNTVYIKVIWS